MVQQMKLTNSNLLKRTINLDSSHLSSKDVNVTGRIVESGKPKEVKHIFFQPKGTKKYRVLSRQRMIFILIFLAPIYFWVVINDDDHRTYSFEYQIRAKGNRQIIHIYSGTLEVKKL